MLCLAIGKSMKIYAYDLRKFQQFLSRYIGTRTNTDNYRYGFAA